MRIARSGSQPSARGNPAWFNWHGASPAAAVPHVAIAEALDGRAVDWLEHVTDAQYGAAPGAP